MPHVIVKLWPGKTEEQKSQLSEAITKEVMKVLNYGQDAVSVGFDEIQPQDWTGKVYRPDIRQKWETLYKKPGYDPIH